MTALRRDPVATRAVHGGGRRPEPEFRVDPAELAEWTAKNQAAIEANRRRATRERRNP